MLLKAARPVLSLADQFMAFGEEGEVEHVPVFVAVRPAEVQRCLHHAGALAGPEDGVPAATVEVTARLSHTIGPPRACPKPRVVDDLRGVIRLDARIHHVIRPAHASLKHESRLEVVETGAVRRHKAGRIAVTDKPLADDVPEAVMDLFVIAEGSFAPPAIGVEHHLVDVVDPVFAVVHPLRLPKQIRETEDPVHCVRVDVVELATVAMLQLHVQPKHVLDIVERAALLHETGIVDQIVGVRQRQRRGRVEAHPHAPQSGSVPVRPDALPVLIVHVLEAVLAVMRVVDLPMRDHLGESGQQDFSLVRVRCLTGQVVQQREVIRRVAGGEVPLVARAQLVDAVAQFVVSPCQPLRQRCTAGRGRLCAVRVVAGSAPQPDQVRQRFLEVGFVRLSAMRLKIQRRELGLGLAFESTDARLVGWERHPGVMGRPRFGHRQGNEGECK